MKHPLITQRIWGLVRAFWKFVGTVRAADNCGELGVRMGGLGSLVQVLCACFLVLSWTASISGHVLLIPLMVI